MSKTVTETISTCFNSLEKELSNLNNGLENHFDKLYNNLHRLDRKLDNLHSSIIDLVYIQKLAVVLLLVFGILIIFVHLI